MLAVCEVLLYAAVTTAVASLPTAPVVAANVAVVAPANTVTEAGAVNNVLLSVTVTTALPAGAALLSLTVHVLDELAPRLVGLHANDDTVTAATRLMLAVCEVLLYDAVTTAVASLPTAPVVAANVAVVAPANTVTEAGTVNNVLLSVTVTTALPAGAALLSLTVHVLDELAPRLVGLHANDDTVTAATRLMLAVCEVLLYAAVTTAVASLPTAPVVAANVAVVAPANTVTEAGTVNSVLLSVTVTTALPAGAALLSLTVHVLDELAPRLVGLHANDDTVTAATRLMLAVCEVLLYDAVTTAVASLPTAPVVAANVAVVAPANTVTEAGAVNSVLLSVTVTTALPAGAALLSVTVHVLDELAPRLVGLHANDDTVTAATRLMLAVCEVLLYAAVTTAVASLPTAPVVAANVAVVAPANTVTEAGTVNTVLFVLVNVTTALPAGAAAVKVTVQLPLLKPANAATHVREETPAGGAGAPPVTVPPVPDDAIDWPALDAAAVLVTPMMVVVTPAAMVRLTTATAPFATVLVFMPEARHVYAPAAKKQFNVLPALVSAVPAEAEIDATLAVG